METASTDRPPQPSDARSSASSVPTDVGDFDELYRSSYETMVRLAVAIVDTVPDAEQVVQDAFVSLFRRWATIENPGGYLRISVVNVARQVLRRRAIARRLTLRSEPVDLGFDHLRDAVRALPPSQRVLVALRYEQQMSDSEIATELGLAIGTVKSRLHRALARLREEMP